MLTSVRANENDVTHVNRTRFIAKAGCFFSAMIMLIGVAIALIMNINRYDGMVGDPVYANVAVYDVEEVVSEGESHQIEYHPKGSFLYNGYNCDVVLSDWYSSKASASEWIGQFREIVFDSATFKQYDVEPFSWLGVVIAIIAFSVAMVFFFIAMYYSPNNESYVLGLQ